jgi:hypothetical protein
MNTAFSREKDLLERLNIKDHPGLILILLVNLSSMILILFTPNSVRKLFSKSDFLAETEFFIRESISKVTADRLGVPTYQRRTLPINPDDLQVKPTKVEQETFYDDLYNKPPSPKEETKKKAVRKFVRMN